VVEERVDGRETVMYGTSGRVKNKGRHTYARQDLVVTMSSRRLALWSTTARAQ
jgi:hypothetical protein